VSGTAEDEDEDDEEEEDDEAGAGAGSTGRATARLSIDTFIDLSFEGDKRAPFPFSHL
jgi:hypothetical protein